MIKIITAMIFSLAIVILAGCGINDGSIIILENSNGKGCEIGFSDWSRQEKYELSLEENDELFIDIDCEEGLLALEIRSSSGLHAYTGNKLNDGKFTVRIKEPGLYSIEIKGEKATGHIYVENLARH